MEGPFLIPDGLGILFKGLLENLSASRIRDASDGQENDLQSLGIHFRLRNLSASGQVA
jgi:hypothetical protein